VVQIVSREVGRPSSYVLRELELPSGYDRFTGAWFAELLRSFQGNLAGRVVKITSRELS
jgi:hypothetical protein